MRLLPIALAAATLALGCRDPGAGDLDSGVGDAPASDGAIDAPAGDGIAAARSAPDGNELLLIYGATVTYLKPQVGNPASDPAGFTIQANRTGPALFVAVDPDTLTPRPQVGDVVNFTITAKRTVAGQPRATEILRYTRVAMGADVTALTQDLSTATDVVSALGSYESELVSITGTVFQDVSAGGTDFQRAMISTAGSVGNTNLQIRAPEEVFDAIDMTNTCQVTVTRVPMGQFNAQAQLGVFSPSDLVLRGCPPPVVVAATATSSTTLVVSFSRNILLSSLVASGSQFVLDRGLAVTAAAVNGRTVTLTTTTQALATSYTLTVAASLTDLQGSPVAAPSTASFVGFDPASAGAGARLSKHTTLGIPSPTSSANPNSFLSAKAEYVLSYNGARKVPNWVSWELNSSYLGAINRADNYRPDDTFPPTQPQASLADYSGSGYQRGHMCPSADRTLTMLANSNTFYLTNMIPQAGNNNQGAWAVLENESRTLVRGGKQLYIISGGTFSASSNTVGDGMVVPDKTFKVIAVLDSVGQGVAAVTTTTRIIAVLMPNENAEIPMGADWRDYRVSVDSIETLTGYDFLSDVPPAIQAVIEARVDGL